MATDVPSSGEPGGVRLFDAVEDHYDHLADLYQHVWGDHIHHGYWAGEDDDRSTAQRRMVDQLVAFADVRPGTTVLDAGCGVGGPAFQLTERLGCRIDAVTLSERQVATGRSRAEEAGLADTVRFHRQNAVATEFPDGAFDVVWSLESMELMPDKAAFLAESLRLLRPGGRLAVATWFSRPDGSGRSDHDLLDQIYQDMSVLHYLVTLPEAGRLCAEVGFVDVETADWTERVVNTWNLVGELFDLSVEDRLRILRLARQRGAEAQRFLRFAPVMREAYATGALRYGVLRATKPTR